MAQVRRLIRATLHSSRHGVRWQALALVAAVMVVLGIGAFLERRLDRSVARLIQATTRARLQSVTAEQLLSAMQDAETGQRGYLLTLREPYLAPYYEAEARAHNLLDQIESLARDTPWLQIELSSLRGLVAAKQAELERTVSAAREGGQSAALPIVLTEEGRILMEGIRRTTERIAGRAESERANLASQLQLRQSTSANAIQAALLAGVVLLGAAAMLLLWSRARLLDTQERERLAADLLQAAIEHVRDGVAVYDPDGRLVLRNSRFAPVLAVPAEIARPGASLSTLQAVERLQPPLLSGPAPAGQSLVGEATRDGRTLEVWRSAMPDGGQMIAVADITRRVEAEAVARQAQKMEVLGQMTGGVAHDFNNLLQVISANLELAAARMTQVGEDEVLTARIAAARDGVARGARLTRHLLAFARRQPLAPEVLEPARVLMGLEDMLRRTVGDRVRLEVVVGGGLWAVRADPNGLESALLNLAVNARDAMTPTVAAAAADGPAEGQAAGRLTVEVANAHLDEAYAAKTAEVTPGQYVMFAVTDTGVGMTPEQLARATEPFYTTKPDGRGTGLGLSMVFGFAKQSGGHFQLYSEPGRGTTARLYIPRTSAPARPATRPDLAAAALAQGELVLLVEDDAAVRSATEAALIGLGYRVETAADASEGIALLEHGTRPALVFTDVVMPGPVSSRELADAARRLVPGVAVVYTSGYTQNSIIHNGELDPGIDLISKPWDAAELARRLRAALDAARQRSALAPTQVAGSAPRPVLLVEDEDAVREVASELLEECGFVVTSVPTAAAALAWTEGNGPPALLVTDLGLPDCDGMSLVARLRSSWPALPVVVMSGALDADNQPRVRGPAPVLLPKPFDARTLRGVVERALA